MKLENEKRKIKILQKYGAADDHRFKSPWNVSILTWCLKDTSDEARRAFQRWGQPLRKPSP